MRSQSSIRNAPYWPFLAIPCGHPLHRTQAADEPPSARVRSFKRYPAPDPRGDSHVEVNRVASVLDSPGRGEQLLWVVGTELEVGGHKAKSVSSSGRAEV